MQLLHLLTISASLLAGIGAAPLSARSAGDVAELDEVYTDIPPVAAAAVQESVERRSPKENAKATKASSVATATKSSDTVTAAKASKAATAASTTEADPRFDAAAASAAEKSAAVSSPWRSYTSSAPCFNPHFTNSYVNIGSSKLRGCQPGCHQSRFTHNCEHRRSKIEHSLSGF